MPVVATDNFGNFASGPDSPARHMAAITPSDTDDLAVVTRAILASADTVAKVTTVGGETLTGVPLQKGYNPVEFTRVWATGTTLAGATLWALW